MTAPAARPAKAQPFRTPEPLDQPSLVEEVHASGIDILRACLQPGDQGRSFLRVLKNQAQAVLDAAVVLSESVTAPDTGQLSGRVLSFRCRVQALGRAMDAGLSKTLFAPLTHEDTRSISAALLASLESIADVTSKPGAVRVLAELALCDASERSAKNVVSAIATLPKGKGIRRSTAEIESCTRKAEIVVRDFEIMQAKTALDPFRLLSSRHATVAIRAMFRRYGEIACRLDYAVLKNG